MAELKTKATAVSVTTFLNAIADDTRRFDCQTLCALMSELSKQPPTMWGSSIVGFGSYRYTYASGHSGEACRIGFAPRKTDLSLYVLTGFAGQDALLAKLGRHKSGKVCLYIRQLADVDMQVLQTIITSAIAHMEQRYPA